MSPIALRARLLRWRGHTALLGLLVTLVAFVAVHHAAPAVDAHHGPEIAAAEMCLGVFTAVGAAVVAAGLALIALGRWAPAILLHPGGVPRTARPPQPRARPGPALLVLLCVSRR